MTGSTQVVDMVIVNGHIVVKDGRLTRVDEERVMAQANAASARLLDNAHAHTGRDYRSR